MDSRALEHVIQLKETGEDAYESIYHPLWTWPGTTKVVPGGTLMALAASAAFKTVTSDFSLDTLQANFIAGPKPDLPLQHAVQRLSDGGRFATRVVTVRQNGSVVVHVTCAFVRTSAMKGPTMTHSVQRKTKERIDSIILDDLEAGRNDRGPYMKFQRLPLVYAGPGPTPQNPPPESMVYTSVAAISPSISTSSGQIHSLGIVALSDYHILDAPPTLHRLDFGIPHINDTSRTPTHTNFERYTSLNHSVRFHVHDGFRADELCYIEVTSPWTQGRRGEVHSRIFDEKGMLIASCVQEAYYVLKGKEHVGKL